MVVPVGAAGAVGCALMVIGVAVETQVLSLVLLTLKLCAPIDRPENVDDD